MEVIIAGAEVDASFMMATQCFSFSPESPQVRCTIALSSNPPPAVFTASRCPIEVRLGPMDHERISPKKAQLLRGLSAR